MSYTEHVFLYGLDQLREFQHACRQGLPIKTKRGGWFVPTPVEIKPLNEDGSPRFRTVDDLSATERQEIMVSKGPAREVAKRYGIKPGRVYVIRQQRPDYVANKVRLTREKMMEIGAVRGPRVEVAERLGVTVKTIERCRNHYNKMTRN